MKIKKYYAVLVLMLAMLLLVGCGRNISSTETAAPVVTAAPAGSAEPVSSPEAVSSPIETTETETTSLPDTSNQTEQPNESAHSENMPSAPIELETADGFMASFLLASDRNLIGTTNEYGVFYKVVYEASLKGDELTACGSMDYRNFKDQDSITISSDLTHVFKVDDNTVYRKGTEEGDKTISKEEFAELLESRKNSGMFFEVEISGGVVKTAYLAAQ